MRRRRAFYMRGLTAVAADAPEVRAQLDAILARMRATNAAANVARLIDTVVAAPPPALAKHLRSNLGSQLNSLVRDMQPDLMNRRSNAQWG